MSKNTLPPWRTYFIDMQSSPNYIPGGNLDSARVYVGPKGLVRFTQSGEAISPLHGDTCSSHPPYFVRDKNFQGIIHVDMDKIVALRANIFTNR